jgi:hypothetical protein
VQPIGRDNLHCVLCFECLEIPAEARGVAPEKRRIRFEDDDQARLTVARRSPIDQLGAEQSLAAARFAFDDDEVAPPNAALKRRIEARDAGCDKIVNVHESSVPRNFHECMCEGRGI